MRVRALIGVLLLSGLTMGIGRGVHDDSPQGCVKAYLDALNSKDLKAALDLLVTAKNATPGDVKSMMPRVRATNFSPPRCMGKAMTSLLQRT